MKINETIKKLITELAAHNDCFDEQTALITGSAALALAGYDIRREVQDIDIWTEDYGTLCENRDGEGISFPPSCKIIKKEDIFKSDYCVAGRWWVEFEGLTIKVEIIETPDEYECSKHLPNYNVSVSLPLGIMQAKLSYVLKGADLEDKHKDDIIYFLTNNQFKL